MWKRNKSLPQFINSIYERKIKIGFEFYGKKPKNQWGTHVQFTLGGWGELNWFIWKVLEEHKK